MFNTLTTSAKPAANVKRAQCLNKWTEQDTKLLKE